MKPAVYRSERPHEAILKKKNFSFRINRLLTGLFNFFYRKGLDYEAMGPEESLQMLLETRKSFIRFGNGESEILIGIDMATQEYDKELQKGLEIILRGYSPESSYLLGLVNRRLTQNVSELKATPNRSAFRIWRFMRYLFWRLGLEKVQMPFLEADMFRRKEGSISHEKIEQLWGGMAAIIVVYSNEECFKRFRERHRDKKTFFVKIPDKNFFHFLPRVQKEILDLIEDNNIDRDDLAILVAAGPGANILCYNLSEKDDALLCYDMGNFFNHYYT